MTSYMETYEKYKKYYTEWCKFDLMNIGDKAMQAVHEKHWVIARLHDARNAHLKLLKAKKQLKKNLVEKIQEKSPVALDKKLLDKIEESPQLENINDEIKDCEFLIKYLEDMVKMMTYIAQDIKNCLDSIKLEQS